MSERMSGKMSEKILDLIMYNSKITTNELAENLGVSTKTIERIVIGKRQRRSPIQRI